MTAKQKDYARSEIQSVAYPQTYPVILEHDGEEEELGQIQGKVEREEGIGVDIESVGPFDCGVRGRRVRWRR